MMMQGAGGGVDFFLFPLLLVMIAYYDLMLHSFPALKSDGTFY